MPLTLHFKRSNVVENIGQVKVDDSHVGDAFASVVQSFETRTLLHHLLKPLLVLTEIAAFLRALLYSHIYVLSLLMPTTMLGILKPEFEIMPYFL